MRISQPRHRRLAAAPLTALALLLAFAGSAAAATTYHVGPDGSDSGTGSESQPLRTIGSAVARARAGDEVLVASGRYPEQVSLSGANSGVTVRGTGPTRPVIDGGGSRQFGFYNLDGDRVTISGFEVTGQTDAGIYTRGRDDEIADNLIHHVGSQSVNASSGIRVVWGGGARVLRNTVHSIGPGGESMGIWLVQTRDAIVDGNSVYLIRKEGVRDWMGLDNTIRNNRVFLNWVGIAFNVSTGAVASNNYLYDNVEGFNAKHTSYQWVLDYWGLTAAHWSKFVHNTVYRSSETSVWLAQSDQPLDYLEVRDNVLDGAGLAYVRDAPAIRGPHVVVDGNAYGDLGGGGAPSFFYKAGWDASPGLSSWDSYRQATGWEEHGSVVDPQFRDPASGDLDYDGAPGAHGLPAADTTWTAYPMTPVDSSSKGTWWTSAMLSATTDNDQSTYWLSATAANEYVAYDFGRERTFSHVVVTLFQHNDVRNPHGYRFEVSDDGVHWRTVLTGENPDTEGSSYKYELPERTTARYLRYTMVDTSCSAYSPRSGCGAYFVLSDIQAGLVTGPGETPPVSDPADPPLDPSPAPSASPPAHRPAPAPTAAKPPVTVPDPPRTSAPGRLAIAPRRPVLRRGGVQVGLSCDGGGCTATVTVVVRPARSGPRRGRPVSDLIVVRRTVPVAAGPGGVVRIPLGRRAAAALRARGRHKVDVLVGVPGAAPVKRTISVRARR